MMLAFISLCFLMVDEIYFDLLSPQAPHVVMDYYLKLQAILNPLSLKLLWAGYFINRKKQDNKNDILRKKYLLVVINLGTLKT